METTPDLEFAIAGEGPNARAARAAGFSDFPALARHVEGLPYGRPLDGDDIAAVLREQRGTCSGKHRFLAAVARECGQPVRLIVGIYAMNEDNTPGVGAVLAREGLATIPEAHCYLGIGNRRLDFTGLNGGQSSPFDALHSETDVAPEALPRVKARLHRTALAEWAEDRGLSLEQAWAIREACISTLTRRGLS